MTTARRKYQVFISSTYDDLREEREHVSWEILKMRHIPAGMESFTAKDERGWKTIARTIDDSDYYLLILAGRYGSIDPAWDKSWTHYEYEYALSKKIPILVFVRDLDAISGNKLDVDRSRIEIFRTLVKSARLCSFWKQKEELAKAVSTALTTQIVDDIDEGNERPGWFRGDVKMSISPEIAEEIARLSAENNTLRQELTKLRSSVSPRLEFIGSNGQPILEYLQVNKKLIFLKDPEEQSSFSSFRIQLPGTPQEQHYVKFLNRRTRTLWLNNINLVNKGTAPGLDIVVEIKIHGCLEVSDSLESRPSQFPASLPGRDSSLRHVYIDSIKSEQSITLVRQRVKSIQPGVTEQLMPLAILAPDSHHTFNRSSGHHSFQIEVKATDQTGESCKLDFTAKLLIEGSDQLDVESIKKRFE